MKNKYLPKNVSKTKHILRIGDLWGMVKHDPFKGSNRDLQVGYMKVRNGITWNKKTSRNLIFLEKPNILFKNTCPQDW